LLAEFFANAGRTPCYEYYFLAEIRGDEVGPVDVVANMVNYVPEYYY